MEYHFAAVFSTSADPQSGAQIDLQEEVSHYASDVIVANAQEVAPALRWWVDSPDAASTRFCVSSTDRGEGLRLAMSVADGFLVHLEQRADERRNTPTNAELEIDYVKSQFRDRLVEAQARLDVATSSIPASDPRIDLDAMLIRWRSLRSDFSATRQQISEAAAGVDRLRSESEPTYGVVTAEDRRRGLESDAALQQDLKELEVHLSQLKLHLLNVWQNTAGRLDQLLGASDDLIKTASISDDARPDPIVQAPVQGVASETETYRNTLMAFTQLWTTEFTALQRLHVDPASGELLDVYHRVRTMLNDFLFAASKGLSAIRSHLSALGRMTADNARRHVLESNLTRAFQALQAAHHRFEFAAGGLDTPDNFRLDAALRSARGLRRRIVEQFQQLEQRLQVEAGDRARNQHVLSVAAAERSLEQTRAASEQTIEQLFSVQDGLIRAVELGEDFLRAVLQAELAAHRLEILQEELASCDLRLAELEALRQAENADVGVELVSCGMTATQFNFARRFRVGGAVFLATLVTVLLGQWWITRSGSRP